MAVPNAVLRSTSDSILVTPCYQRLTGLTMTETKVKLSPVLLRRKQIPRIRTIEIVFPQEISKHIFVGQNFNDAKGWLAPVAQQHSSGWRSRIRFYAVILPTFSFWATPRSHLVSSTHNKICPHSADLDYRASNHIKQYNTLAYLHTLWQEFAGLSRRARQSSSSKRFPPLLKNFGDCIYQIGKALKPKYLG